MRDVRFLSIILVVPLAAACSSSPDDVAGSSSEALGQYAAVEITQVDYSACWKYNCGPASAAMMRAVMTGDSSEWPCSSTDASCEGGRKKTAQKMREYYNAIAQGTAFEDGFCGGGTTRAGLAKTLSKISSFDIQATKEHAAAHIGDGEIDLSADCANDPYACTGKKKSMSQCELEARLNPQPSTCGTTKFLGGYVAAVAGSIDNVPKSSPWYGKGSPCYDGGEHHYIFVHDYDPNTDTFTVYDPACHEVAQASWPAARLFDWANGSAGVIEDMVYGRGKQHVASQPPPDPQCPPETDAQFCADMQKDCEKVTGTDNCGAQRQVNCGSCSGTKTCGGGGVDNVCGYGSYDDDEDFPLAWWLTGTIRNDGLCARAHVASGEVRMTTCSQTDQNQNWRRTVSRQLQNVGSGTCAQASSITKAGVVSHAACSTSTSQDWSMTGVEIVQGTTGYCLAIPYGNYVDGAPVRYRVCSDKDNQKFTYDLATETISPMSAPNLCFDASSTNVTLRACNGAASQKWNDAHRGFVSGGLCLGVEGGPNAETPANAQVQTCTDTEDQMWGMRGKLQLHASSNLCLQAAPSGMQMLTAACDDNDPLQKITVWSQP
jgi:hypothetical protein